MRKPFVVLLTLVPSCVFGQSAEELALAQSVLAALQAQSFAENREFCGYIGFDHQGVLRATPATRGQQGSCLAQEPAVLNLITASYHTHGGFSPAFYNELPSLSDVEGDEEEGIDGYVATPGGRMWFVDGVDLTVSQICGLGCLPQDPRFTPGNSGTIAQSYTYEGLAAKLEE